MNEEKLQKVIEEIIEVREERMKREEEEEETFLEWKEINDNKYKVLYKYERLVDIILELKHTISDMPLTLVSPVLPIKYVIEKAEKIIKE